MLFRYRLLTSGLIIFLFMIIGGLGSGIARMETPIFETFNRSNLIRLHVVANSDSPVDQATKLKIRDQIIKVTEPFLIKVENPVEAEMILAQKIDLFEQTAHEELIRNGQDLPVKVRLGKFSFPERCYPFGILPAGEYKAIQVVLGKGQGKNWWCVLYPPLCLLDRDAPSFKGTGTTGQLKFEYHLEFLEKLVKEKGLTMDEFWKGWGGFFGLLGSANGSRQE